MRILIVMVIMISVVMDIVQIKLKVLVVYKQYQTREAIGLLQTVLLVRQYAPMAAAQSQIGNAANTEF
jgi:hypothetical protein